MDFSQLAFERQWEQCFSLVDKWKSSMISQILEIHREKSAEIQRYKDQAENDSSLEKSNLVLNLNEYFQHSCILSCEINSFKKKLNQLKANIIHRPLPLHIEIDRCSLDQSISIHPLFTDQLFHERNTLAKYQIETTSIRLIASSANEILLVNHQSHMLLYEQSRGFIEQFNLADHTKESLNDICYSITYQNFLFLCDHSLWSWQNYHFIKLAHIRNRPAKLNHLTSFGNYLFLVYNQGEFLDRWRIQPDWKLEKRWSRQLNNEILVSIHSNEDYLLFYTQQAIQFYSKDLSLQYSIDLSHCQEHLYSNFLFLPSYDLWLTVDENTHLLNYFQLNDDSTIIHPLGQISVRAISLLGKHLALITKNKDYHLQIINV